MTDASNPPHVFTRPFRVRSYECDLLGHLNNAVYQQYCEQVSIEASEDAGYDAAWYADRGTAWVIRHIAIEYLQPAAADDVLDVTTWVSHWRRVWAQREYQLRRRSDAQDVARASAKWVYLDRATGRPKRIPAEIENLIGAHEGVVKPYRLPEASRGQRSFHWRHKVRRYELDAMQHVNNAVYLNWVEEAKFRAAEEAGWPLERARAANLVTVQIRHATEYFVPAVYGDEVDVVSRLYDVRRVRGTWLHEVYRQRDGVLLVRNYSTGAFLNLEGRPQRLPEGMLEDLL
jgi:acyl-CoA thioester hydrolase